MFYFDKNRIKHFLTAIAYLENVRVEVCRIIFLEKREAVFCFSNLRRAGPVNFPSGEGKETPPDSKVSDLLLLTPFFSLKEAKA